MSALNVETLDIHKQTTKSLQNNHINQLSPVQQAIVSKMQNEEHLVLKAEPNDDKYLGFAIAASEVVHNADRQKTRVLIITDASKNAQTIARQVQTFLGDEAVCLCLDDDGEPDQQAKQLEDGPAVVVATPACLQELLQQQHFIFRTVDFLVLDDLDLMLKHGQAGNLKRIKRRLLSDYTGCICTDTYDTETKQTVAAFVEDPAVTGFEKSPGSAPPIAGDLTQGYINVPYRMKISTLLAHVNESKSSGGCIIFTASKRGTDRLYKALKNQGKKATSLHGKLSDEKSSHRFSNFANGNVQYLLVADISAAKLQVQSVHHVVNYDVPNSLDEYRYRAALLDGADSAQIVSLVSKQDRSDISELQNELGQTPDEMPLPRQVQQKVKERKQKKSRGNKKQSKKKRKKSDGLHLPEPSYDKLSGGRNGDHDKKKTGVVKFFKKLFS